MSDINFLSETEEKNNKDGVGRPEDPGEIEWTAPVVEPAGVRPGPESGKAPVAENVGVPADSVPEVPVKEARGGFFGFLKNIRRTPAKGAETELGLKANKEILAQAQDVIDEEKNKRKNRIGTADFASATAAAAGSKWPKKKVKTAEEEANLWKAPQVLKTNLIQDEVTVFIDWSRNGRLLLYVLAVCLALIGGSYFLIFLWGMDEESKSSGLTNDVENIKMKIVQLENNVSEIGDFQKKLAAIDALLAKHVYWTNFFSFLEESTLPNVFFANGFSGTTAGSFHLSAVADSYQALSEQLAVLDGRSEVLNAEILSGELSGKPAGGEDQTGGVNFDLELEVSPEIFLKP